MPDSSLTDNALVAKLGADATLLALCPNGVYWAGKVPEQATRFVEVSLVESVDEAAMTERAMESALYQVKAVMLSTAGGDSKAAAARVDTLLEDGTLTASGYRLATMHRETRVRYVEVDEVDPTIRWEHRGGHYRVVMSTT